MKTKKIIAFMFISMAIFTSCDKETIRVTGEVTRTEVNITEYTGLRVSDAFNVNVTFSDNEESIIIEANEDIQDRIEVKKDGEDLNIRLKRHTSIRGNATLNVYITTGNISSFNISGASNITLDNTLSAENLSLQLSGASGFTGELIVDNLELDASGASDLDIYGTAGLFNARLAGASNLNDYDLIVSELDVELSGASNSYLSVTEKIDIRASGASTLNYKGDAIVATKDLSGSSEINKMN